MENPFKGVFAQRSQKVQFKLITREKGSQIGVTIFFSGIVALREDVGMEIDSITQILIRFE